MRQPMWPIHRLRCCFPHMTNIANFWCSLHCTRTMSFTIWYSIGESTTTIRPMKHEQLFSLLLAAFEASWVARLEYVRIRWNQSHGETAREIRKIKGRAGRERERRSANEIQRQEAKNGTSTSWYLPIFGICHANFYRCASLHMSCKCGKRSRWSSALKIPCNFSGGLFIN